MSTRTRLAPFLAIKNGDMSANITSEVTVLQSLSLFSYTYSWTGTSPVGTIEVQSSNDFSLNPDGSIDNPGTWNTLPLNLNGSPVTSIPVSGDTGEGTVDVSSTGLYAVRTVYTFTSGVGSLTAIIAGKVA